MWLRSRRGLIEVFDHEPEIKSRIAKALTDWDDQPTTVPSTGPAAPTGSAAALAVAAPTKFTPVNQANEATGGMS